MPFSVGRGTPKNIIIASIGVGGTAKAILNGWVGVGGVPKRFYATATLAASLSHTLLAANYSNAVGGQFIGNSAQVSVNVTGSTGTVSYQWNKVSGPSYINAAPADETPTVFVYNHTAGIAGTAVFECVVTDSTGSVTTNQVAVSFS